MPRTIGAAALAATLAFLPAAAAAASYSFSLDLRLEVDVENAIGDLDALDVAVNPSLTGSSTETGSGTLRGAGSSGTARPTPLRLGRAGLLGDGSTSPFALGEAATVQRYEAEFVLFNGGAGVLRLPIFLFYDLTVSAEAGDWGDAFAQMGFSGTLIDTVIGEFGIDPVRVESRTGDGSVTRSGVIDLRLAIAPAELGDIVFVIDAEGSARTTQPIQPIPVPAGAWLLLSALGALVLAGRARR